MTTPVRPRVTVVEVGPRDGFQMEATFIPTALKVEVIDAVTESGVSKIEATSFVSPKAIPQMRDAAEVMARIRRRPGVVYSALVPNLRGAHAAIDAGVDVVRLVVCATETYNLRNVGMSVEASLQALEAIVRMASDANRPTEVAIALAFGCPLEGEVPESRVVALAQRIASLGVGLIAIADSVGFANPIQVTSVFTRLHAVLPAVTWTVHLHDTRGMGLANALAAHNAGIAEFDAAIGGLGGCPVVPGATGNIASEDVAHMFEEIGVDTGVDLDTLMRASRMMQSFLGRPLPSRVLKAGTRAAAWRQAHGATA